MSSFNLFWLENTANWTSSFLVQSDKLAIVLHWLRAQCGYSGDASRARSCSSSKSDSEGDAMLSAESQVDAMIDWWKDKGSVN